MAQYHVPFVLGSSLTPDEALTVAAKQIAGRREHFVIDPGQARIITPIEEAVRLIVREELEAFRADIVKQVIDDLGTEMRLQQGLGGTK